MTAVIDNQHLTLDFNAVEPEALQKMMLDNGWEKIRDFPDRATVWRSPDESTTQWVPSQKNYDDYDRWACEAYRASSMAHCSKSARVDIVKTLFKPALPDEASQLNDEGLLDWVEMQIKALLGKYDFPYGSFHFARNSA